VDRIATFRTFIEKSPRDPFPRYGLAMEFKSQGRLVEARAAFDELLASFPDYVPAYLHAASTLTGLGERDLAAEMLRKGIAAAIAKPDPHARKELEAALAEI
jgi:tetratricopeptide (TPR) repeat protein